MAKIGKYEFALETIITFLLLFVFGFYTYMRKYFVAYVLIQYLCGRYRGNSLLVWDEISALIKSHIIYLVFTVLIAPHTMYTPIYLFKLVCMVAVSFVLCSVLQRYLHIWLRNECKENVLVFGVGRTAESVKFVVNGNRFSMMDIQAFVNCNSVLHKKQVQRVDTDRTIYLNEVDSYLENHRIDSCIFAVNELSKKELMYLMDVVRDKVDNITFVPRMEGSVTFNSRVRNFDGLVLVSTAIGMMTFVDKVCKRFIDICAGLVGTLICIPLTVFVYSYNLKCNDKGPVFFYQDRIGVNGKPFKMIKYRSMIMNAEQVLEELMEKDPAIREEYLTNKKLENDPRITKAGNFLRKSSLDEFPQFINVLKGDMSLIGPRPYLFREIEDMGKYYDTVIKSKPGITGMWQTHGRNDVSFEDRLEMDDYYYRNWNIWLDVQLIVRTFQTVLMKVGAK